MQDKIILGLLQFRALSAYDLKKAIEKSTSNFYNASMGSIHPAIKKLLAAQLVSVDERVDNGRLKKIYSINQAGRDVFGGWLDEGVILGKFKDLTMVKLYFLGFTSKQEQIKHIRNHIVELDEEVAKLELLNKHFEQIEIPEDHKTHFMFQIATLDFGLEYYRFAKKWFEKFLATKLK